MTDFARHVVELPIRFDQGSGRTRVVSREEVEFTTQAPLAAGDRIAGSLRFQGKHGRDTVFHYVALVLGAKLKGRDRLEVRARFEQIQLAAAD
ncbi:hypothetical protein [Geminicoccus roseus]|uniref:hypothetical protein n=1 Tax=Geminicoccus roseus TaxID=404900 RepID=UPI000404CB4C|nr:hypothetical protein [Geminicoccus roseus]